MTELGSSDIIKSCVRSLNSIMMTKRIAVSRLPSQERSCVPVLPLEVHGTIAEFVPDKADLARLARACHITQPGAERQLYRKVILNPVRHSALCTTVIETSRFAKHIRTCEIYLAGSGGDFHVAELEKPEYHDLSKRLLSRLPSFQGLVELTVRGLMMGANVHLGSALVICSFNLVKFTSSCPLDALTSDFLMRSKSLEEVSIISSRFTGSKDEISTLESKRDHIISNPGPLSNRSPSEPWPGGRKKRVLRTLVLDTVPLLSYDRPFTHLEVIVWTGDVNTAKSYLTKSTVPLHSFLVTQGFKVRKDDLKTLGGYLPNLRYLGECHFTEKLDVVQNEIRAFPKLQTLVMNYQSLIYLLGHGTEKEILRSSNSLFSEPNARTQAEEEVVLGLGNTNQSLQRFIFTAALAPIAVWERQGKDWVKLSKESYNIMLCIDLWKRA